MFSFILPLDRIDDEAVKKGLRRLVFDGICSQVLGVLTGGAFLAAFALSMGASNKTIGLIAAIGPLCQLMQIPAIFLIEKVAYRKLLVSSSVFCARFCWLVIAFIPWIATGDMRLALMLFLLFLIHCSSAIAGCAWNSWIRDFVPENVRGTYFAKRMAVATGTGAVISLLAGFSINYLKPHFASEAKVYSVLFLFGVISGFIGIFFLAFTPEPRMVVGKTQGLLTTLIEPFKDRRFKNLLIFLANWNFAINLAAPFFTVYMLKKLNMKMSWIIGLSVLSQIVNVIFFSIWGRLSDRFTNKSCLSVSGFLFIISIAMWPFTTMPETHALTIPLLILIHVLTGISTAGVALCSGNISLKFAPDGKATSYLAVNGIVCGIVATLAPILAGASTDWFGQRQLKLTFTWIVEKKAFYLPALDLQGLDFLFIIAFILGVYSLHRLLVVKEEGEVEGKIVYQELIAEMRHSFRSVTTIAGLRNFTVIPFEALFKTAKSFVPVNKNEK